MGTQPPQQIIQREGREADTDEGSDKRIPDFCVRYDGEGRVHLHVNGRLVLSEQDGLGFTLAIDASEPRAQLRVYEPRIAVQASDNPDEIIRPIGRYAAGSAIW